MFGPLKHGLGLAAVLGLSGAVVIGLATPASAGPGENQAVGLSAEGLIVAGPIVEASFPSGPETDTVASAAVPNLLEGINVTGRTDTFTVTAGPTSASARLENVVLFFLPRDAQPFEFVLASDVVHSECSYDPTTGVVTGDTTFGNPGDSIGGPLNGPGEFAPIALDANPMPNQEFVISDQQNPATPSPGTITFNRQTVNADGSLTVDAIYAELTNGQTITVATSHCHKEVLSLAIPVIAPQFALGAGVLGLFVLGFFLDRRRQNSALGSRV